MSPWERFPRAAKKPPPKDGIKIKKTGATWWGKRWIQALETLLGGDSGRLARGRTYARAGRTHDLVVKGGKVTAKVTGSRATPYAITIELKQLGNDEWRRAIAALAEKAAFTADLLAGTMPIEIDEAFHAAQTSLFPKRRADLVTSCSCPDWGDPCKHVAATHYVLGEALDRDPFLLFELRGRTKEQVLTELRVARGGQDAPNETKPAKASLRALRPADYEVPSEALPAMHFSFDAPVTHGALLRQLGVPATWSGERSPADALAPLVRDAAETARRLALGDPEPSKSPIETGARQRRRARPRS